MNRVQDRADHVKHYACILYATCCNPLLEKQVVIECHNNRQTDAMLTS